MASIGTSTVGLGLDASGFISGMNKATSSANKFAGALLGLGSVGFTVFIKKSLSAAVAMGKFAAETGSEVSALTSLEFAAKKTGASVSDLRSAISTLGQKTNQPIEALFDFANTLQEIPGSANKARAAMAKLGAGGGNLVQMLSRGEKGLQELTSEAEKLGLTMDETMIAKAEIANEKWNTLTAQMASFGRKVTIELTPVISIVTGLLTKFNEGGENFGVKIAKFIVKMVDTFRDFGFRLSVVGITLKLFALKFAELAVAASKLIIGTLENVRILKITRLKGLDREGAKGGARVSLSDIRKQVEKELFDLLEKGAPKSIGPSLFSAFNKEVSQRAGRKVDEGPGFTGPFLEFGKKRKKLTGAAREINLDLISIGGASGKLAAPQKTEDKVVAKKIDETNNNLRDLKDAFKKIADLVPGTPPILQGLFG